MASRSRKHLESGNVLWFILIAVALLGILTAVLSRSGSSVDQSGDVEQARVKASTILRYTGGLEAAIQQMMLRGVSENEISFENSVTSTDYTNSRCNDQECLVFDVDGGGLEYTAPPRGANDGSDWIFTGHNNVGTTAGPVGTTEDRRGNDLLIMLRNVPKGLCVQLNRDLGVDNPSGDPPVDTTGIALTPFVGTFYDGSGTPVILDGDPTPFDLDRQKSGCFLDGVLGDRFFYHVLLAR